MRRSRPHWEIKIAVCLLLSLALHGLLAWWFIQELPPTPRPKAVSRVLRVSRSAAEKPGRQVEAPPEEKAKPEEPPGLAKTNPDAPERAPERKDHIGKRNARAASAPDSADLKSNEEAPAMTGVEQRELVTFDEDVQDGDMESEGKRQPAPQMPAPPQPDMAAPTLQQDTAASTLPTTLPPVPDIQEHNELQQQEEESGSGEKSTQAPTAQTAPPREFWEDYVTLPTEPIRISPPPMPPPPPRRPTIYRDPTLADHYDSNGFRTYERRSRSTGTFILGGNAAVNVSATPLGDYEYTIYRRIAYHWYIACAEHRGDIIPGQVVISLRLDKNGRLVNMELVRRRGAGIIQQSFTFGAIRKADFPPMPPAVQEEMVGDLLELIFEFNFN